ncbi:MAG: hypothetical protein HY908_29085 [Myxococcales bacterium]|nr:hypothetical protein [Myxococcales bacterium]
MARGRRWALGLGLGALAVGASCQLVSGVGDYSFGAGAGGGGTGGAGGSGGAEPCAGASYCGLWAVTFPVTGNLAASRTDALAREGAATVAVGEFAGMGTFAPGVTVPSTGLTDFFAVRVHDDGQKELVATYGGNAFDLLAGFAAVDFGGHYWVAGSNLGSPSFGGQTLQGTGIFLAHFGPNVDAVVPYPTPSISGGELGALAVDAAGNLYAAGAFGGTVDLGLGSMAATALDGLVVGFDPVGALRWVVQLGGAGDQRARGVAVDADGSVVVGGEYQSELVHHGQTEPGSASGDGFVLRLAATDGQAVDFRRITGASGSRAVRAVVRAGSSLLVAGDFSGQSDIAGTPQTASDVREAFVAELGPSLATTWHVGIGGNTLLLQAVALDVAGGRITVALRCPSQIRFDGKTILGGGGSNVCLAQLTEAGAPLWAASLGDDLDQTVTSVRALPDGAVVGGSASGDLDLGDLVLQASNTRQEAYVFRLLAP